MQKEYVRIGDWVRFHTKWGPTTGMLENFLPGYPKRAIITVGRLLGGPKKYIRPCYKLKKVELV